MKEALEKGFLGAPNRNRMKFALMWANYDHRDQFCIEGDPRNPFGVMNDAWNEWTEGDGMVPAEGAGTADRETIKGVK
ncbi:MAG TPA: hypothetical protein PLW35_12935 [Verrucomicrobiota bacterium]|mgnify:CR=1 FL=1|nr:hypothetical protein [Verrucomicrobiota bacterium]